MGKEGITTTDDDRGGGIQVIARAASILEVLGAHPHGMSLGEIALNVDLPRSTVQRIVGALEAARLVRSEGAGGIGLGAGLLRLMSAAHVDIVSVSRPWLRILSETTEETVVLSRQSKLQLVVVDRLVADRELQVIPRLGLINMPLYNSSAGRALLSLGSDSQFLELIEANAAFLAEHGKPRLPEIQRQLQEVRETGVACDHGEMMEGITTVAVALETLLGRFAVSLPIPTVRFERRRTEYVSQLKECKERLLRDIGIDPGTD